MFTRLAAIRARQLPSKLRKSPARRPSSLNPTALPEGIVHTNTPGPRGRTVLSN
jgi:hypothetical protein